MSHKEDEVKTHRAKPNKSLKRRPSLQTKLQDIKEVKKLHTSEEKFSYYDEYKSFELGVVKTLKPQFMYDAAAARNKDEEREARERYEEIRRMFWKKWAPAGEEAKKPQKVYGKGLSKLRPFDLDLMRPSNPAEAVTLKESSEMYREVLNRAALDSIEFASNLKPPTCRMTRLPRLVRSLKTNIAATERRASNLLIHGSETSSIENVKEWIKHLNPYAGVPEVQKRVSMSARRARMSIPCVQVKKSRLLPVSRTRRKVRTKHAKLKSKQVLGKPVLDKSRTGGISIPLDGTFSTISMVQLLTYNTEPPSSDNVTVIKRRVNATKKALELKDDIEMVKNLTVTTPAEACESKASCKLDPFQVDPTPAKHWQERRLYFQKQQGINYDINFNNPCLQYLNYAPPKKGTRRTPLG